MVLLKWARQHRIDFISSIFHVELSTIDLSRFQCIRANLFLPPINFLHLIIHWGRRVIGISRSLIWSKTLMKLIFNPYGEFRWSPEGPVSLIHSPHFHVGALGVFSDLLRFVQTLKRERERERGVQKAMGSYCTYSVPGKTAVLVPEFAVEDLPLAELQPKLLHLQWRTCPWAEYSDDDESFISDETVAIFHIWRNTCIFFNHKMHSNL